MGRECLVPHDRDLQRRIRDQLLEIPLDVLKLIADVTVQPVGRRLGRQSLAADVYGTSGELFRVHFDGADGKCQIRGLSVRVQDASGMGTARCRLKPADYSHLLDLRNTGQ